MERLTHRYMDGEAWTSISGVCACGENECKGRVIARLAAIEDILGDEYDLDHLRELVEAERTDGWISVEDRLPEPFQAVLVCRPGYERPIVEQGRLDVGGWWKVYGTRTKSVTHWMPFPKPPEEAEG